ncbi:MAG: biotin transporter BioY [Agathobaculum sp.]|jgi:biotin transport system substrate-specific component|uniref:biotin transporter BioY n=1 Tax=Agathobaculum sp. TaxID=2048138 RepID=UPI003D89C4DA
MERKQKGDVRMLALSALFTALIAVGAFIRVPVPMWPFTLQTLFTTMAALLLGPRYGTLACAAYMVLGLAGLPVFTGGGGPQYIFQPTFGCIVGFAAGALLAGTIVQRASRRSFRLYVAAGLADAAVVYIIGMAWFWAVKAFYLHDPIGIWTLFVTCFVPTIGVDICKAIAAAALAVRLEPVLGLYRSAAKAE